MQGDCLCLKNFVQNVIKCVTVKMQIKGNARTAIVKLVETRMQLMKIMELLLMTQTNVNGVNNA